MPDAQFPLADNFAYIGVYDSGLGGLGVWRELTRVLPAERVLYIADSARMPYGARTASEIRQFSREISGFMCSLGVKIIIAACNTSSALALPTLTGVVPVPLVGMIKPAVIQALGISKSGRIGLLATEATVRSQAYDLFVTQMNPRAQLISQACPRLVPLIEGGTLSGPIMTAALHEYIDPLLAAAVDCIILGCTHYPLVYGEIAAIAGSGINIVDPAAAVAADAKTVLTGLHRLNTQRAGEDQAYVSGDPAAFTAEAQRLGFNLPPMVQKVALQGMDKRLPTVAGAFM